MSTPATTANIYAHPGHNRLLDLLPVADHDWLQPQLQRRTYRLSEIIVRRDRPITHVYFPTTLNASVITQMNNGESVESGIIGNEGFIGIPVLLHAETTPNETICQGEGEALALDVADFRAAVERSSAFRSLFGRYTQAYLVQSSQSTACNGLHHIQARCAKWLLMTHDRVGHDEFPMTHEYLSMMLGVRRASVSVAAAALQKAGIISYQRGRVTVLDRAALEAESCECYALTRQEYDRLVG